ncbi:DUF1963 domain-containing protein [Kitasatospora sp. LaBMicrA B282]|uniref:DUF1963 domain-containing protein n=1 Tax=Kitasatospora sp. LaBMicrA B282 TaxID=3420949 RepID=UPI003D10E916
MEFDDPVSMRRICAERLGAAAGRQFATLARRGFRLEPATGDTEPTGRDEDGPAVQLLQLAEDAELGWGWGDAGTLYFTIPAKAFAAGDFGRAEATGRCC